MDDLTEPHCSTRFFYAAPETPAGARITVRSLGIHEGMPPCAIHHGGPGWPCLFICFHDESHVVDRDGARIPAAGTAMLWPRHAVHDYGNPAAPWDHSWLVVDGPAVDEALQGSDLPVGIPFAVPEEPVFVTYLGAIYEEVHHHAPPDREILEGLLRLWFRAMARAHARRERMPWLPERLARVRRHIESHLDDPPALAELARIAHLSVSHFSALFRAHMGTSPMRYVQRTRMRRAAHLLLDRNMAVYEVATVLGFEDALYFSRLFRRVHGMSPSDYRRRHRAGA